MTVEKDEKLSEVGALGKRRVEMADGRRYLIYYTFENGGEAAKNAVKLSNDTAQNSAAKKEETNV